MNNKAYYLSTCSTCKRILSEISLPESVKLIDIKEQPIQADELDALREKVDSYESLLNKRAQLYKQRDLKNKILSEDDYKSLLLEHYTFLKRPVFLIDGQIFVGNDKNTITRLKQFLSV